MNEIQLTTNVTPPAEKRTGRPRRAIWRDFLAKLETARNLKTWSGLTLPPGTSRPYALRMARKAGFSASEGDQPNEIKVLYK